MLSNKKKIIKRLEFGRFIIITLYSKYESHKERKGQ